MSDQHASRPKDGAPEGTLPVPTEQDIKALRASSDQSELSQQEIEQLPKGADAQHPVPNDTPLPTGKRQDDDTGDDDDMLRADMVNAGD